MTVDEQGAIIEAYRMGREIEFQDNDGEIWYTLRTRYPENFEFDFQGYRYRLKPERWRADTGCNYFYINIFGEINQLTEIDGDADAQLYKLGNYFRTRKKAEKVRDQLKALLINFHENE